MFSLKNIVTCTLRNDDADENVNIEEVGIIVIIFRILQLTLHVNLTKRSSIRLENRRSSLFVSTTETLIWPFHGVV